MRATVDLARLLVDALKKKDVISEGEVTRSASELNAKLTLQNVLTPRELKEVAGRLRHLRLPEPKGWAEAIWIGAQRQEARQFSAEKVYGECGLRNLITVLNTAGLRNEKIFKKLENAAQLAEDYRIE